MHVSSTAGPFDGSGTEVGADGIRRYRGLHRNVVALLRDTVARFPTAPR